jgi:pantoate--beta-alanine ligase
MQIIQQLSSLKKTIKVWQKQGATIGLVPTMGALHKGHLSLISAARQQTDKVVVSIFVNPMQFNEPADYQAYPRDLDSDLAKLASSQPDLVFTPRVSQIYPRGWQQITQVAPGLAANKVYLESQHRPRHFQGVTTILTKLLHMISPDLLFMGQKDYDQLAIVKQMIIDLDFTTEVVAVPTLREEDGLALSSRNRLLSPAERQQAPLIYQSLKQTAQALQRGDRQFLALAEQAQSSLTKAGFQVEYYRILQADLQPPGTQSDRWVILTAVRLGQVRLIDNLYLSTL